MKPSNIFWSAIVILLQIIVFYYTTIFIGVVLNISIGMLWLSYELREPDSSIVGTRLNLLAVMIVFLFIIFEFIPKSFTAFNNWLDNTFSKKK